MVKFSHFAPHSKFAKMGHLTKEQRYKIQVLLKEGFSQSKIAKRIGKHKSIVCRELQRNYDKRSGEYRAELAGRK